MSRTLVWDASALHHAADADRLDVLGDLARGPSEGPWRNLTTAAVVAEMRRNNLVVRQDWLEVVHVDEPDELRSVLTWARRLGAGDRDLGETTVCAWADVHGGATVIDDKHARQTAKAFGLTVHGRLWVIAEGIKAGRSTSCSANALVNRLIGSGARFPFRENGFEEWAAKAGLLA
ncbi:hypothetical protein NLX83_13980 [Allokutzneria sp. A3M-2-11 16]|uniref:hypothetical protein n=1 Tax=Allokutzneria sp. A3M-2-11 16 TaxID=2962043 RepID=UPI0020B80A23|nr:hypothetical protein [Allokutzneria sp. A3M-2-11 16]MCP3800369.1 hypothetical protein [Allokutzneria sp. A3M-2-11 16]